MKLINSSWAT